MHIPDGLLQSVPQTRYLSAERWYAYRSIMRTFYLEYQTMHYQLDQDALLSHLRQLPAFQDYTAEQLIQDLDQLVKWKNLTPIQDPHKAYTIADFKNRQFQYMMTEAALEVERMTIQLETLHTQAGGLSTSAFARIERALAIADRLGELSLKEVGDWWQDLQEDFRRLRQNHQDYLREFYGGKGEKLLKSTEFLIYKQHLIHYLEEFIQELQSSSARIAAQLERLSPEQVSAMLERVHQSALEVPRPQSEQQPFWQEHLRHQEEGVWVSLMKWFTGRDSTARQVLDVTNEVIRRVVQNAAMLIQMQNLGASNKSDLHHLLTLFAQTQTVEEAHCLSAMVFGVPQVRHFSVNRERQSDRIDLSIYEEPPVTYTVQPRVRTYRPRQERTGFADKREEKAAQLQQIKAHNEHLKQQVLSHIKNGQLDFSALTQPLTPEVRTVYLSWVALAALSPDHTGLTQYGQRFRVEHHGTQLCDLVCTDGTLTMPSCTLIFEETAHV